MAVVFDASMLVYVVTPNAAAPEDKATGQPVQHCSERIAHLLDNLEQRGERIVIPTPALAEVLVKASEAAAEYLSRLTASRHFSIRPFDTLAAVEHAAIQRERQASGTIPRAPARAKAKFDDQIFAIARVSAAETIYSDDPDIAQLCGHFGIACEGIADLPLPPSDPQMSLGLLD
ncbi:MAG: PIN domain-containing protein [Brevundimonas sp.]|jgi:predicted nucleic acid-binding protein|uniref:PIN domain-containing protein n=1 Tax=Brevundimonas sp. TaxID=1871086 RepID=UPI0022CA851A|nr:PIN domain-containing protein [Brevundimonas sp.]MCZ8195104.1 PIN domain-containing protein [Brevundimonas sp.]